MWIFKVFLKKPKIWTGFLQPLSTALSFSAMSSNNRPAQNAVYTQQHMIHMAYFAVVFTSCSLETFTEK